MKNWRQIAKGTLVIAVLMTAFVVVVRSPHPLAQAEQNDGPAYYGFFSPYASQTEPPTPVERLFNTFGSPNAVERMQHSTLNQFRPFRQWRRWANSSQNPALTFSFVLAFSIFLRLVAPRTTRNAENTYRVHSFRSFLYGAFAAAGLATLARAAMISGIGWPAGLVLIGTSQIGHFAGIAIVSTSLGKLCSRCLGMESTNWLLRHPVFLAGMELFAGSLILAACIVIPGFGSLPPLGTRLVSLLATTGFGALCKSIRDANLKNETQAEAT
jgi:hypothetical protein